MNRYDWMRRCDVSGMGASGRIVTMGTQSTTLFGMLRSYIITPLSLIEPKGNLGFTMGLGSLQQVGVLYSF